MRLYRQPLMLSRLVPVAGPQDMSLCVKVLWNLGTGPQLVATTPERVQATVQDLSALQRVPAWPVGTAQLGGKFTMQAPAHLQPNVVIGPPGRKRSCPEADDSMAFAA